MLVAKIRWRRLAFSLPRPRHPSSLASRSGLVATSLLLDRADRVHAFTGTMDVCDKKAWGGGGCGGIMNHFSTAAASAHREAKAMTKERGKDNATISQRATRIVEGGSAKKDEDNACPRFDHQLHIFNTASGTDHALQLMGPRQDAVYLDQSVPMQSRRPWRVEE